MKNSTITLVLTTICAFSMTGAGTLEGASPAVGMYIGTTDQGRDFNLRVVNGGVDQWFINVSISCQYGTVSGGVSTTISTPCAIEEDGSFVCGSVNCPAQFFSSEVGGVFSPDNTVTGSVEVGARLGSNCCYATISYDAELFVEEVFADGFETGNCAEWSMEVPGAG